MASGTGSKGQAALCSFEENIKVLLDKYGNGMKFDPSVSSRLTDFCLKTVVDVLQKSQKVAEFSKEDCIKVDHVKFALEMMEDKSKTISKEDLIKNAALRNQTKLPTNVEESKTSGHLTTRSHLHHEPAEHSPEAHEASRLSNLTCR